MQSPEAKDEIKELKYLYCYYTDSFAKDDLASLFTHDAHFEIGAFDVESGRSGIEEYIEWLSDKGFISLAHNVFNPVIEVKGDIASGKWYYIVLYNKNNDRYEIGHGTYLDKYKRTSDGWKFSSLKAKRNMNISLVA